MALSGSTLNFSNILYYAVLMRNLNSYAVSNYTHAILLSQEVVRGWGSTSGLGESELIGDFSESVFHKNKYGKITKTTILEL